MQSKKYGNNQMGKTSPYGMSQFSDATIVYGNSPTCATASGYGSYQATSTSINNAPTCGTQSYGSQLNYPVLPTGIPTGPVIVPIQPTDVSTDSATQSQVPQTLESTAYLPGFLKTQIGKRIRVEFLIGSNAPLVDRIGTLLGVGASYILMRPVDSDDMLTCDIYSIKFVTIML